MDSPKSELNVSKPVKSINSLMKMDCATLAQFTKLFKTTNASAKPTTLEMPDLEDVNSPVQLVNSNIKEDVLNVPSTSNSEAKLVDVPVLMEPI